MYLRCPDNLIIQELAMFFTSNIWYKITSENEMKKQGKIKKLT